MSKFPSRLTQELSQTAGWQKEALLGALEQIEKLNKQHNLDVAQEMLLAVDRFAPIARRYSFMARPH